MEKNTFIYMECLFLLCMCMLAYDAAEQINITFLNDNHVCPTSRARWQDFTVYLETKSRMCLIEITFNARFKQEQVYQNTWWGSNQQYIYTTVYDPEIKIVDLHGWQGSNWNG